MIRISVFRLAVFVAAGLMASCSSGANKPEDKTITIARTGDNVSLDPAVTVNSGDGTIINLCYDTLTSIDSTSNDGRARGDLAQSWSTSSDGLTWIFKLKKGFRFSSGAEVTAQDVVYSFVRVAKIGRAPSQGLFWLKSVTADDPQTVRFALSFPFPALPKILSLTSGAIVDSKAADAHANKGDFAKAWLSENCAGSGPYTVQSWQRGQKLTMVANPYAANKPSHFGRVVFKIVPDASSRREQLAKGDVDFVDTISAAEASYYAALPRVALEETNTSNTLNFLTLNTKRAVLQDVRVRRAIAAAIDYEAIRDRLLKGNAIVLNGPIPPGVPGHDPSLPQPTRNVALAKSLLAQAGHRDGIDLSMIVGAPGPVAELVQSNLADAGIRLHLLRLAPSALDSARASGDFDVIYDGWIMDFPDPFIFLNLAFASPSAGGVGNFSGYSNPELDSLLQEAASEADQAKRTALYDQAQKIILRDQPVVLLFSPKTIAAARQSLTGVRLNPYQPNYLNVAGMGRK
jgi:peptide/nickel transport system substrate-binding protein